MDEKAPKKFTDSVMYKLSYYWFWEEYTGKGKGYDLVRKSKIGHV